MKRCDHPRIVPERIAGSRTGDYVCAICGEDFTPAEYREILAQRREAAHRAKQRPGAGFDPSEASGGAL